MKAIFEVLETKVELGSQFESKTQEMQQQLNQASGMWKELDARSSQGSTESLVKNLVATMEDRLNSHIQSSDTTLRECTDSQAYVHKEILGVHEHMQRIKAEVDQVKHDGVLQAQMGKQHTVEAIRDSKNAIDVHFRRVEEKMREARRIAEEASPTAVSLLREHMEQASAADIEICKKYCDEKVDRMKHYEADKLGTLVERQNEVSMRALQDTYTMLHKSGMSEMETISQRHSQKRFEEMKQTFGDLQRKAEIHHNAMMASEIKAEVGQVRTDLEKVLANEMSQLATRESVLGELRGQRESLLGELQGQRESIMGEVESLVLPVVAQYCQNAIVASHN